MDFNTTIVRRADDRVAAARDPSIVQAVNGRSRLHGLHGHAYESQQLATHVQCALSTKISRWHTIYMNTPIQHARKGAQKDRGAIRLRLQNWTQNYTQYQIKYLKRSVKFASFSLAFEWNLAYVVGWEDDSAS